tara:strand:- start:49 stop:732 length:684 start_codon:yes stop_codon:yes gene_type:complete
MNDFLKNLTLEYIDTGIGGYGQKYPTDASFIKAWESADYIDDVVEKFDNDATQRKIDSVTKKLKSLVAGKKGLESHGSVTAYIVNTGTKSNNPKIVNVDLYRTERAEKDGAIESNKEDAFQSHRWYDGDVDYYFFRSSTQVHAELDENIGKLQSQLTEYENGTRKERCYVNGTTSIRTKERRIEEKYNITLKVLRSRPYRPAFDANAFLISCRHAFNEYDQKRESAK